MFSFSLFQFIILSKPQIKDLELQKLSSLIGLKFENNQILISKNEGWNFWIEKLIYYQDLRNKIGNAARDFVIKNYTPSVRAREYLDFNNDLTRKIETKSNRFLYHYYMIVASLNLYAKILKLNIKLSK